jgi:protein gp37
MIFVNSMSDLFHDQVPDEYIVAVAKVMAAARWHTFQVLTKRSERLRHLLATALHFASALPHIWWGVSVEDKKHGLPRIDHLRATPAAVKFLSVEPLLESLGTLDVTGINWVIVGGESGPGARPMNPDWVIAIRDCCRDARVPFFFKQWGGVRKSATGRKLEGKTHDEYPTRIQQTVSSEQDRLLAAKLIEEPFLHGGSVTISAVALPSNGAVRAF